MKNEKNSIKSIFIRRMTYSAIIQIIVFGLILIFVKNYFSHNQKNSISNDLIINDSFTIEEIGKYHLLNNKYALDLELHNLVDEKRLDSINFYYNLNKIKELNSCENLNQNGFKICKTSDGIFSGVSPIKVANEIVGYVVTNKKYNLIFSVPISYGLLVILLTICGVFVFNFLFLFLSMKRNFEVNTRHLLKFISHKTNSLVAPPQLTIDEYNRIAKKFIEERAEIDRLQRDKAYYEARKNIAKQVAHDIRSPLAALNILTSQDLSLQGQSRILVRNVISRIRDIANDLVEQNRELHEVTVTTNDRSIQLLNAVIYPLITEKRLQLRSNSQVTIEIDLCSDNYGLFVEINLSEFKRMLSNIINNAIEALSGSGLILIKLSHDKEYIQLTISDNGKGIPLDVLKNLGQCGMSYEKETGSGLGLYHAKNTMETLGGNLQLTSQLHQGTDVIHTFPRALTPIWFLPELKILPNTTLIILDDDISIHQLWKERFKYYESNITMLNFTTATQFSEWYVKTQETPCPILYFFDLELFGCSQTGVDLIEKYELRENSILVTSHFEDISIHMRCEELGIKMIPKDLAVFVPIVLLQLEEEAGIESASANPLLSDLHVSQII